MAFFGHRLGGCALVGLAAFVKGLVNSIGCKR